MSEGSLQMEMVTVLAGSRDYCKRPITRYIENLQSHSTLEILFFSGKRPITRYIENLQSHSTLEILFLFTICLYSF